MDLRTHAKLAIASVIIASVFWLGVHNEDRITIPIQVPVTYEHPDDIVRLLDVKEVEVRVRATRNRLATVSSADVSVIVDNSEGFTGSRLEFLDGAVESSFGIEIDSVEPARIQIEYDRLSSRSVPVNVSWSGEPADGWRVDENSTRAEPPRVQVEGPSKLLAALDRISTLPVNVAGAQEDVRASVLELQPPGSQLSLVETFRVGAVVPVVPRIGAQSYPNVPVRVVPGEWETSPPNPPRLEVRVEGPLPSLRKLPLSAIQLTVDMRGKEPKSGDYRVDVNTGVDQSLCQGCSVIRLSPQLKVDVAVRSRKRATAPPVQSPAATTTATAQQEPAGTPSSNPKAAEPPASGSNGPDEPGRTG